MQMIRLNVRKQNQEKKSKENLDLDEKIRRIREENKAREKRFKEIEDDKWSAITGAPQPSKGRESCENNHGKSRGVLVGTQDRKFNKGRGQRLLEMSKEPLKAKSFQSKAVMECFSQSSKGMAGFSSDVGSQVVFTSSDVGSVNRIKQTSKFGRFKIWNKMDDNFDRHNIEQQGENWVKSDNKVYKLTDDGLEFTEESTTDIKELKETKVDKGNDNRTLTYSSLPEQATANIEEVGTAEETDHDSKNEADTSVSDEGIHICPSDNFSDNVDEKMDNIEAKQEELGKGSEHDTDIHTKDEYDVFDVEEKKASKKDNRPKITVNTKLTKTTSTSSFDEAISMMSPLDVPTNWGDCDFEESDDYFNKPITF